MDGTRCTCGGGCPTYGACLRAKGIRVGYCQSAKGAAGDATLQKVHDREIDLYRQARKQGIQPAGSDMAASRFALDQSDKRGRAFDAENPLGGVSP